MPFEIPMETLRTRLSGNSSVLLLMIVCKLYEKKIEVKHKILTVLFLLLLCRIELCKDEHVLRLETSADVPH